MPDTKENPRVKLAKLLRELFQFDLADLDFGIYRVMNYKRAEIERFIDKDMIEKTEEVFKKLAASSAEVLRTELDKLRSEINADFGTETIDERGAVRKHQDAPKVKEYVRKQEALRSAKGQVNEVYNHIYEFFSRYYDRGDFISKRKIGGREKYVIPYNGEEVMFHWANKDQYYIKTGENFTNYEFGAGGWRVRFVLVQAEVEQGNIKGDKRYFILAPGKPAELNKEKKELRVLFQYRGLTEDEGKAFAKRNIQEDIVRKSVDKVFGEIAGSDIEAVLNKKEENEERTFLEKHLSRYVKRNTMDYFIHKNLKGFLERELEFYIKSEVLQLDEIAGMNESALRLKLGLVKTMREIGETIIEFLAQIEEFQKMLFEKKKFVLRTDYCMTLDMVPEEFYKEIGQNREQVAEWKKLFKLDEVMNGTLMPTMGKEVLNMDFLKAYPHLVLDTKSFGQDFKDRLLDRFDSIDTQIDGILMKSEGFQALSLLIDTFQNRVKCIYSDPPFNTGGSGFVYKNEYQHSSWCSMVGNLLDMARRYLTTDGVIFNAIDDFELYNLGLVMDGTFGEENKLGLLVVENKPSGRTQDEFLATCHEYYLCYSANPKETNMIFFELSEDRKSEYKEEDEKGYYKWRDFLRTGGYSTPEERPNSFYPVYYNEETGELSVTKKPDAIEILPIDSSGRKRVWRKTKPSFMKHVERGEIKVRRGKTGEYKIDIIDRIKEGVRPKSVWVGSKYDAATHGTKLVKSMFYPETLFDYPKSVYAVEDIIRMISEPEDCDIILDFFAGSGTTGHAVLNLNAEDGGDRKYILIEMGHHFDMVLKPRIQKVMFSKEWKDGKPTSKEGHSHAFKYMYLEQYEDTLNNIVFKEPDKTTQQTLESFKDYFIRYMLDYETRGSPARMALKEFEDPFNYKLWIETNGVRNHQTVDLVETFNYLLGLVVEKLWAKKDGDRYYKAVSGKKRDDQTVLVVWRSTKDLDLKRDKQFIERSFLTDFKPDILYVNGQCLVKDAKPIEPDFKELMGA